MNERDFREVMDTCQEKSGNNLKAYLAQFENQPTVVSLLSGVEFDDIGLGRKSVRSVAQRVYDFEDDEGDLTTSLAEHCDPKMKTSGIGIDVLHGDLLMLDDKSGGDQKDFLEEMFRDYRYPSVVSYAVLSDVSLGFGESTLAKAFGVKDSLPFYESVVQILRDDDPRTSPEVGEPFSPQLAKSESYLPDDLGGWKSQVKLDGYRSLLSSSNGQTAAFSRRQNKISESLPELDEISFPDGEYILDAEVVSENDSYSEVSQRIGRSAENVDRSVNMEFAAFDVVVYEGIDVSDCPYRERLDLLQNLVESVDDGRLWVPELYDDHEEAKDEVIRQEGEGLIHKKMDAPYEFGKRSSYWIKEKFDANSVDVRIVGLEEGTGKLGGTMGKVSIESDDGVPLGSCGSGWTEARRDEVWENQQDWIGRTIEIEARGLGSGDRLRMPIFKRDRSDDGEPDDFDRIEEVMQEV